MNILSVFKRNKKTENSVVINRISKDIIVEDINSLLNDLEINKIQMINQYMYDTYKNELKELKRIWITKITTRKFVDQDLSTKSNIIFKIVNLRTKFDLYMKEVGFDLLYDYYKENLINRLNELVTELKTIKLSDAINTLNEIKKYYQNINNNEEINTLFNETYYKICKYYYINNNINSKNEILNNIEIFKEFIINDAYEYIEMNNNEELKSVLLFDDLNDNNNVIKIYTMLNGYISNKIKLSSSYNDLLLFVNNNASFN